MRCSKAVQLLQFYIDKHLSLHKLRKLETHLSQCDACRNELYLLEMIEQALDGLELVTEPPDLTLNIMRRVALNPKKVEAVAASGREASFVLFRPSLTELLAAVFMATITTLSIILGQPSLRAVLPIANGHDAFSQTFIHVWSALLTLNSSTLMFVFWVFGTILGVWITLLFAGSEMRTQWYKAMIDRLPVW